MIPPTPDDERKIAVKRVADALRQDRNLLGPELHERCIETKRHWYWGKPSVSSRTW